MTEVLPKRQSPSVCGKDGSGVIGKVVGIVLSAVGLVLFILWLLTAYFGLFTTSIIYSWFANWWIFGFGVGSLAVGLVFWIGLAVMCKGSK